MGYDRLKLVLETDYKKFKRDEEGKETDMKSEFTKLKNY